MRLEFSIVIMQLLNNSMIDIVIQLRMCINSFSECVLIWSYELENLYLKCKTYIMFIAYLLLNEYR